MVSLGLCSLRAPPHAPQCVSNLKPVAQTKAPAQVNRSLSQKDGVYLSLLSVCSSLWVVDCQEFSLQLLQLCVTQECKCCLPSPHSLLQPPARQSGGISWVPVSRTKAHTHVRTPLYSWKKKWHPLVGVRQRKSVKVVPTSQKGFSCVLIQISPPQASTLRLDFKVKNEPLSDKSGCISIGCFYAGAWDRQVLV